MTSNTTNQTFDPTTIVRPDPILMPYYVLVSILTGPLVFFVIIPLWFKYLTLRYRFDNEGISMAWGVLFRRETILTYRRIQDIHVTRNIVQRWMGLATVSVQTASGNSSAEVAIEGILQADELRDYLYTKMRGARGLAEATPAATEAPADQVLVLLREIRDNLSRDRNTSSGGAQ